MPRDFTIYNDSSWISGSVGGNTIFRPLIQHVNSVPSLKNTNNPYKLFLGDKKTSENDSIVDRVEQTVKPITVNLENEILRVRRIQTNSTPKKVDNHLNSGPSPTVRTLDTKDLARTLNINLPAAPFKKIK